MALTYRSCGSHYVTTDVLYLVLVLIFRRGLENGFHSPISFAGFTSFRNVFVVDLDLSSRKTDVGEADVNGG